MREQAPTAGTPDTAEWCASCDEITEAVPVYECGSCGAASDERRCPDCNKFAARREEDGCETCFDPTTTIDIVTDHDGTLIRAEDYQPDGESLATRRAVEQAQAAAAHARRREENRAALINAGRTTTWANVTVGDTTIPDPDDQFAVLFGPRRIRHISHGPNGRLLIVLGRENGADNFLHAHQDDQVTLGPASTEPTTPYGQYTLLPTRENMVTGSPMRTIEITTGHSSRGQDQPDVPVLVIRTSRGNTSVLLGCWFDPAVAAAALDALQETAEALAAMTGHPLNPDAGAAHVTVTEATWVHQEPTPAMTVQVGHDEWEDKPLAVFTTPRNYMHTFADADALAYAVRQARTLLPTLTLETRS